MKSMNVKTAAENRIFAPEPIKLTKDQKRKGDVKNRIPVQLDKNTVIFVYKSKDPEEVRRIYENRHLLPFRGSINQL